jgi:hypothetical protein
MKTLKAIAGCFGLLVAAFAAMIFMGWMLGRSEELGKEAHEKTLMPYFTAITQDRLREAYDGYTSEGFRKRHSFAEFEKAHRGHPVPDLDKFRPPGGGTGAEPHGSGARLFYMWHTKGGGENDYTALYYDVIPDKDRPKIDETWGTYTSEVMTSSGRKGERKLRQEIW